MPRDRASEGGFGRHLARHSGRIAAGGAYWFAAAALLASALLHVTKLAWVEAGLSVVGGAAFLIVPLARWRQHVDLFERGLVWRGLFATRSFRREQVSSAKFATRYRLGRHEEEVALATSDGAVTWVGLERPRQLCQKIEAWRAGEGPFPRAR